MTSSRRETWKEAGLGLLNLVAVFGAAIVASNLLHRHLPPMTGQAVIAAWGLLVYLAGSKWIEKRSTVELSPSGSVSQTLMGFVLGFVLFTTTMAILWIAGIYHPQGYGSAARVPAEFAFAVGAGVLEEILFRALLFRVSSKILGTWGALVFSAAFFGAAHAFNPGATVTSSLAIALEAGILLGAAYAATKRLWVPIGLHVAWNFTEGSVFGMSISGTGANLGLIRGTLNGPQILTGGQFGPEASIVAVLVCMAAAAYFLGRIVRLRRVEPPVWAA